MSNQSSSQKNDSQRTNHLQSENIPFSLQSPHQLAQFSAATASGYHPKPQVKAPTHSSGSSASGTNASQTKHPTTQSDFVASANAAAGGQSVKGLQPPQAQSIDLSTFKGFIFSMLDEFQIETREVYDEVADTFQWEMFQNQEERCIKYIREDCVNKRVFIITSGSLGRKVVPVIHDLPQVYAIYIYCADVKYNQEWASKYYKIRVVCNNDDRDLLPQFAVDVAQANIDYGDAFVKQNQRDKAKPKYEKAVKNLEIYRTVSDPTMLKKAQGKLDECK